MDATAWLCRFGFCNQAHGLILHTCLLSSSLVSWCNYYYNYYCHDAHDERDLPLDLVSGGEPVLDADSDGGK